MASTPLPVLFSRRSTLPSTNEVLTVGSSPSQLRLGSTESSGVIDHPQYRRMLFRRFGPPDVFEWDAIRPRALAPGEVLVQVRFIGVNYADIIARRGYYK